MEHNKMRGNCNFLKIKTKIKVENRQDERVAKQNVIFKSNQSEMISTKIMWIRNKIRRN